MARGGNANRTRTASGHNKNKNAASSASSSLKAAHDEAFLIRNIHEQIEKHWEYMPPGTKPFLLQTLTLDFFGFSKLAKFWSQPGMIEHTRGGITGMVGSMCGISWSIALNYLKLGQISKASLLTVNGAFLHQCSHTSIEVILEMCGPNFDQLIDYLKLPLFAQGFDSLRTPEATEKYLRGPLKYQNMISFPDKALEYVDNIGDDWSGTSPAKSRKKKSTNTPEAEATQIQLIIADGANEDDKHYFDIGSSTTLKSLFNDYADQRGVSLRLLRFSYGGKTLFLSSVGNKSPDELQMQDQDIITVHNMNNADQETNSSNKPKKPISNKNETTKKSQKKTKGKHKKKQKKHEKPVKTLEEFKAQHSKILSKLHEEAEDRLKEIRMRLNALDLERQPPKQKKKKKRKKTAQASSVDIPNLPNTGIGGKAGKPYFLVQVGEVQNLYKTTKPSSSQSQHGLCSASASLDLHGHTREEAIAALDKHVKVWVDTAMQGSYPFVIPVTIVCGCGNQILHETVEKWIKSTRNVGNAPNQVLH